MIFLTKGIKIDPHVNGGVLVSFHSLDMAYKQELLHKYENGNYEVSITKKREARSLDANAYLWVLIGKISFHKDIVLSKINVYKEAIKDYGVSAIIPIKNEQMKDILRWHVDAKLGNSFDIIGACKNFEDYTNVRFFYGSSGYTKDQMSRLIDGVVADCKDLGIETLTPSEIERMKEEWGDE
jgi:hypothetical protein